MLDKIIDALIGETVHEVLTGRQEGQKAYVARDTEYRSKKR